MERCVDTSIASFQRRRSEAVANLSVCGFGFLENLLLSRQWFSKPLQRELKAKVYLTGSGAAPQGIALVLGPEDSEGAGVAMQKGGATDRADLAVAEEPSQGHRPQMFLENAGIVVGAPVKVFAAAQARK